MEYREVRALATRGPNDPGPEEALGRVILVGTEPAGIWQDSENSYGCDLCSLFPVWDRGERAWMLRRVWDPARGYCAQGTEESIIPFEEGMRLLIERGTFAFPVPK